MKILSLLFVIISISFASDFFKNGNYVVDKKHNLFWQDTKDNITILKNQAGAVEYCENLTLSGYSDWELPTREQYEYIIDKSRKDELLINRRFEYVLSDHYWTSDRTWRNFFRWGYFVYFKSGTFYYENKTYPKYLRCVRESK